MAEHWLDAAMSLTRNEAGQCVACVDEHSGQKKFNTTEIPESIAVAGVVDKGNGTVEVSWQNDIQRYAETAHTSRISLSVMAESQARFFVPRRSKGWDRLKMEKTFTKVNYEHYMRVDDAFREVLTQLKEYGLVVITNVPEDEKSVERIGERIGPLRHTFYGRTWDVKDKPKAENVAYTSGYLGLHMDLL